MYEHGFNKFNVIGYSRDSHVLDISNFECAKGLLEETWEKVKDKYITLYPYTKEYEPVYTRKSYNCLCGWSIQLYVNSDIPELLDRAKEIIRFLDEEYPVLNDEDYSNKTFERASETWASLPLKDRLYYISKCDQISIFAARHDHLPECNHGCIESLLNE